MPTSSVGLVKAGDILTTTLTNGVEPSSLCYYVPLH